MRYVVLVLLNMPVILTALANILTQYKMKRITARRFRYQIFLWLAIFGGLISSFPLYNYLSGNDIFDASVLSAFDILEITAIIYLIYVINNQRLKIEKSERLVRDLHQEVSIKFAVINKNK